MDWIYNGIKLTDIASNRILNSLQVERLGDIDALVDYTQTERHVFRKGSESLVYEAVSLGAKLDLFGSYSSVKTAESPSLYIISLDKHYVTVSDSTMTQLKASSYSYSVINDEDIEAASKHPAFRRIFRNPDFSENNDSTSRFSGALWYNEIRKKTVMLAGLGGIGSHTAFMLGRLRPKAMFIYDNDTVDASNMSGQLYAFSDIGNPKTSAICNTINQYSRFEDVFCMNELYTNDSEACDIMICGFDNMASRKVFFGNWRNHVSGKNEEYRKNCLFIDGRLSAEYFEVYCITGDRYRDMMQYEHTLFDDNEADPTVCSYKQTSFVANMIGNVITNCFVNFVSNNFVGQQIREVPYKTTYDALSMSFKLE